VSLYVNIPASNSGRDAGLYNVMNYGAAGDAKQVLDGVTTSQSNVVTSASNPWTPGDTGKRVFVNWNTGQSIISPGTIIAVDSPGQIRCSNNAINGASGGSSIVCWATKDDTQAFTDAFSAATAGVSYVNNASMLKPPGTVIVPAGGYMVSGRIYNNNTGGLVSSPPALIGAGPLQTNIYMTPDFTVPGSGGALIACTGANLILQDFHVWGGYHSYSVAAGQQLIQIAQCTNYSMTRVQVHDAGVSANGIVIGISGSYGTMESVIVQNGPTNTGSGAAAAVFDDVAGNVLDCLFSNYNNNCIVKNHDGRTPSTGPLNFWGVKIDEGGQPFQLLNGTLNAYGCIFFGPDGTGPIPYAIYVDGTSKLWINDSNIGRFQAYGLGGRALQIDSGGVVYSKGNTWRGNETAPTKYILNNGTYRNIGGNDYVRYAVGGGSSVDTAAQAIGGSGSILDPPNA
jgi:hypothetical protein